MEGSIFYYLRAVFTPKRMLFLLKIDPSECSSDILEKMLSFMAFFCFP